MARPACHPDVTGPHTQALAVGADGVREHRVGRPLCCDPRPSPTAWSWFGLGSHVLVILGGDIPFNALCGLCVHFVCCAKCALQQVGCGQRWFKPETGGGVCVVIGSCPLGLTLLGHQ